MISIRFFGRRTVPCPPVAKRLVRGGLGDTVAVVTPGS
jgi:hypothetical protein